MHHHQQVTWRSLALNLSNLSNLISLHSLRIVYNTYIARKVNLITYFANTSRFCSKIIEIHFSTFHDRTDCRRSIVVRSMSCRGKAAIDGIWGNQEALSRRWGCRERRWSRERCWNSRHIVKHRLAWMNSHVIEFLLCGEQTRDIVIFIMLHLANNYLYLVI